LKLKILIITTAHPPFDVRIFHLQAISLAAAGHRVMLLAHADFDQLEREGVHLVGVKRAKSRLLRFFNVMRFFRMARRIRADVYHFHDLEFLPAGLLLRWLTRKKVIYDCHENYPETAYERAWYPDLLKPLLAGLIAGFEPALARRLDAVVCVVKDQESRFKQRGCRTALVRNYPRLEPFEKALEYKSRRDQTVLYLGGLTQVRGAALLVDMMAELRKSHPNVKLICIGRFNEPHVQNEVLKRVRKLGLGDRIRYLGYIPYEQVPDHLVRAKIGLIPFQPNKKMLRMFLAIKAIEYMASGLPIVASDLPSLRHLISEAENGILVAPSDAAAHAAAIAELLENEDRRRRLAENGLRHVRRRYNWKLENPSLHQLYRTI